MLNEDFSSATGSKPPVGWSNLTVTGPATDEWRYDNPGKRSAAFPIVGQFAIFDSENYSGGNGVEKVSLETPYVDCSFSPFIILYFDHEFKSQRGGKAEIEVFNGTAWVVVKTYTDSTIGTVKESIDVSQLIGRKTNAKVRFTWNGDSSRYWIVDNVKLLAPLSRDARVKQLDVPTVPVKAGVSPIAVTLANEGYETITSGILRWTANGIRQTDYNWTGNIVRDSAQSNINIGSYNFPAGSRTKFKIWVDNPNGMNDLNKLNDTLNLDLFTALCGTYTIGGVNPDFPTFTDAALALNSAGVACPVIFKVREGVYEEQVRLFKIPGTSAVNTVTFESESGDSSKVQLHYKVNNPTNDYSLKFSGAEYVTVKKITIQRTNGYLAVVSDDQASNLTLEGNDLFSINIQKTNGFRFIGNRFTTPHWMWNTEVTSSKNIFFSGNLFNTALAIRIFGVQSDSIFIKNNLLKWAPTPHGGQGINVENGINGLLEIDGNQIRDFVNLAMTINVQNPGTTRITNNRIDNIRDVGIQTDGQAMNITGNHITGILAGTGMVLNSRNSLVANNFIHTTGLGNSKGIVIQPNSSGTKILFNSINVTGTDAVNGRALEMNGGEGYVVKNNILSNPGSGYAFYLNADPKTYDISHNDYYSSTNKIGYYNKKDFDTLSSFIAATGQGNGSIQVNPYFVYDTLPTPSNALLEGSALPFVEITSDISGSPRNALPDMGAKEFDLCSPDAGINGFSGIINPSPVGIASIKVALQNNGNVALTSTQIFWRINGVAQPVFQWNGNLSSRQSETVVLGSYNFKAGSVFKLEAWTSGANGVADCKPSNDTCDVFTLGTQLCGVYTIGGQNPDFASFSDAAIALNSAGVSCPVVFKVRNGVYDEQLKLFKIPGASEINTVTFESERGDSTKVELNYQVSNPTNDFTVKFNGANHVIIRQISILRVNGVIGVFVENQSNNIKLANNMLHSVAIQNSEKIELTANNITTPHWMWNLEVFGSKHVNINNNIIKAFLGIRFHHLPSDSIVIRRNNIQWLPHSGSGSALNIEGSIQNLIEVDSNVMRNFYTGIYLAASAAVKANLRYNKIDSVRDAGIILNGDAGNVIGNKILRVQAGHGIQVNGSNAFIANNHIHTEGPGLSKGIVLQGNASAAKVLFNNVNVMGTDLVNGRAIEVTNPNSHIIRNNIFSNRGGGYAAYFGGDVSNFTISHNNYYSSRSKIGFYRSKEYDTLSNFVAATKQGVGSLNQNPYFISDTILVPTHALLDGSGFAINEVQNDITGRVRASIPDIGASEFDLCVNDAGVNGFSNLSNPIPNGNIPIKVILQNNGSSPLTATTINWTVNGVPKQAYQWTGNIASKQSQVVELGVNNFSQGGVFKLRAWTSGANGQADCKLPNDSSDVLNLGSQLCGTYTIGGFNPDFKTFTDAGLVLNNSGIGCPVVFKVRDGIYDEQVRLFNIPGATAVNTVTFESESGDSTKVELHYKQSNPTSDFTLKFSGANHVVFRKMSILRSNGGYSVLGDNKSFDISLKNMVLNPVNFENTSSLLIKNNRINTFESMWSIQIFHSRNLRIEGNTLNNCRYGIGINGGQSDSIFIVSNEINGVYERYGDVYAINADRTVERVLVIDSNIIRNFLQFAIHVSAPQTANPKIRFNLLDNNRDAGIIVTGEGTSEIYGNRILRTQAGTGIAVQAKNVLVANNYIHTAGLGISKGIVLHPTATGSRVVFNSVNVTGVDVVNGRALEVLGGSNYTIKNNIFANNGGGVAAHFNTLPAVKDIDYNNYYSKGNKFATLGSQSFNELPLWGAAISGDANSKNINPNYKSDTALLPFQKQLNGAGIASSNILLDIDGELRNLQAPDIGAQEFMVDFGITRLLSPTNECKHDAKTPITVYLRQFGDIPFIDLKLAYQINGGPVFRDTIPGSISNDLEFTFTKTQDLSLNGIYEFKLWLIENGDDNQFNDTLTITRKNKDAPVVDFSYANQCAGINVPFTATASVTSGFIDRVEWEFGDSTIGVGLTPTHRYDTSGRYMVTVKAFSDQGCYSEIKKLVTLKSTPVASFTAADACYGNAIKPKNTTFMMGDGSVASYLWKWGDGNTATAFEPVYQYAANDTFNVTLIVTATNGCVDSIVKPVVTYSLENSSFRLAKPFQDFICEDSTLKLSASGAFSYQWYLDSKPITGAKDSVYQAVKSGAYSVIFFNQLGCQSKPNGNIKLTINPKPKADFSYEGYCLGLPTKFTDKSKVDSLNKIKYLWNFGDGSPTVQVASPTHTFTKSGEYKVSLIVQSMVCPNQTDTSTKKIEPETPKKGKKYESESVVDGKSKKLEARDFGEKYQWIPSTYLDNPNIREPKYTAGKEQKYIIRITSKAGCVTVDTLQVLFFDKCNVIVPGGFSPNDDGKNERLYPFRIGMKNMKLFRIYDRFGNLVFDDKNANSATGWDGTYKGKKLPVGSYVWIAEGTGEDEQQIKRTGNVMLVR